MNTKTIVTVLLIIAAIGIIFFLIYGKRNLTNPESSFVETTSTVQPTNEYPDTQTPINPTSFTEPVSPSFPQTGTNPE